LKIDPKYPEAWTNLGTLLQKFNNLKEAEVVIENIVEIDPKHASIKYIGLVINIDQKFKDIALDDDDLIRDSPEFLELLK